MAFTALVWRLSYAPLDITAFADRWSPITVKKGLDPHHPAGRLIWTDLSLQWQPGHGRFIPQIVLDARGLRILRQDGTSVLALSTARINVSLLSLIRGRFAPIAIEAYDGRLALKRDAKGRLDFDWNDADDTQQKSPILSLGRLLRVNAEALTVTLDGGQPSIHPTLLVDQMHLTRKKRAPLLAIRGNVTGRFYTDGKEPVALSFTGMPTLTHEVCTFTSHAIEPRAFEGALPILSAWHVPITLLGKVMFPLAMFRHDPALETGRPFRAHLTVAMGAGLINQKDAPALNVESGDFDVDLNMGVRRTQITVDRAKISLLNDLRQPHVVRAEGKLVADDLRHPGDIAADLKLTASAINVGHVESVWPVGLAPHLRRWVTANMTRGRATGLSVRASLQSAEGWRHIDLKDITATLRVDQATVHWLRPVPAAENVSASLHFLKPDTLQIDFLGGSQSLRSRRSPSSLAILGGKMLISDLWGHEPKGDLRLSLAGDLRDYLEVLSHPRLHLLSRHPLPFSNPSGSVALQARLFLPLSRHADDSAFRVLATAEFSRVALDRAIYGYNLTEGIGRLSVTEHHLHIDSQARITGVPTTLIFDENFSQRSGSEKERVHAVSTLDPQQFRRLGERAEFDAQGHAVLTTDYASTFDGAASLAFALNLKGAAVTTPLWRKERQDPSTVSVRLNLAQGKLVSFDRGSISGPGLNIVGEGTFEKGRLRSAHITHFRLGKSQGRIEVLQLQNAESRTHVQVLAETIDLTPFLSSFKADAKRVAHGRKVGSAPASATHWLDRKNWTLDVYTQALVLCAQCRLRNARLHIKNTPGRARQARFEALQPTRVEAKLVPHQAGQRFDLRIADLGRLLSQSNVTHRVKGGAVQLSGLVADQRSKAAPLFKGKLSISAFDVASPPAALTTLTHLSLFHWSQANPQRILVEHSHIPFVLNKKTVTIHDGYLGNPALGITIGGTIGLNKMTLDLKGTVVPVFGLNSAPGRLPHVGRWFAPEKEGGMIAASYQLKGRASDPTFSVNKFSLFLPGIMRSLAY